MSNYISNYIGLTEEKALMFARVSVLESRIILKDGKIINDLNKFTDHFQNRINFVIKDNIVIEAFIG